MCGDFGATRRMVRRTSRTREETVRQQRQDGGGHADIEPIALAHETNDREHDARDRSCDQEQQSQLHKPSAAQLARHSEDPSTDRNGRGSPLNM